MRFLEYAELAVHRTACVMSHALAEDILMPSFPSYHLDTQLYASSTTAVYRAWRTLNQQPVILKILQDTVPERLAAFKREYEILHALRLPGVVQTYSLEHEVDTWFMVLEDSGGESLTRLHHYNIKASE